MRMNIKDYQTGEVYKAVKVQDPSRCALCAEFVHAWLEDTEHPLSQEQFGAIEFKPFKVWGGPGVRDTYFCLQCLGKFGWL